MNQKLLAFSLALGMAFAAVAVAQTAPSSQVARPATAAVEEKRPDPQIISAMRQVSRERLQANIEKLASFRSRNTISSPNPQENEIGAAREWIKSEFQRYSQACGGCLEVHADAFSEAPAPRIPQTTEIVNVYAVLRGTDPQAAKRIYLVSGHYDSRASDTLDAHAPAPGANDDGSGTAVSLEAARVLSAYRFPATIIFLTVAGEEQGLNGARHFSRMAREQGWQIGAVLNDDTVGGDRSPRQDPTVLRVFSEGVPVSAGEAELRRIRSTGAENDSPSRQLARYLVEISRSYMPGPFGPQMIFRPDRYLRGGDHLAFNQEGFAAVRLTEYRENYDHQHQNPRTENGIEYGDLPKFVDYAYLAKVARLNVAVLASLASAPAPPVNIKLETKNLENDSTLVWQCGAEGPACASIAYEVLWRATTSAEWEHVEPAGNGARYTAPRSKDNVVFAVRAVDAAGHRSLPVMPAPER